MNNRHRALTEPSIIGNAVHEAAHDIAHTTLRSRDPRFEADTPLLTDIHLIQPATFENGVKVCMKVRLKAVEAAIAEQRIPYNPLELNTFRLLDNQFPWAARLIDFAPDTSWILREWFGSGTLLDRLEPSVPLDVIERVWDLFAQAFAFFHDRDTPWLIRDLKPQNVAVDGDRLSLFDFNTTMPLSAIRTGNFPNRLGRPIDGNLYNPPELLTSTCPDAAVSSDYFAFATLVTVLLTGRRPFWSNTESDMNAARRQYQAEYETEMPGLATTAEDAGLTPAQIDFLVASLNPDPAQRPDRFLAI